jgi:hypothetical protein
MRFVITGELFVRTIFVALAAAAAALELGAAIRRRNGLGKFSSSLRSYNGAWSVVAEETIVVAVGGFGRSSSVDFAEVNPDCFCPDANEVVELEEDEDEDGEGTEGFWSRSGLREPFKDGRLERVEPLPLG